MKQHRLQRIAQAALDRAQLTAWVLLLLGVTAFLLLPLAGNKCYLDEKALLVGGALPTVRQSGAFSACMAAYQQALPAAGSGDIAILAGAAAASVASSMPSAGPPLAFHCHTFNSSGGSGRCSTLHTVVRSPRGDGSEGFVLLLPLHAVSASSEGTAAAALAAALGVATAAHLRQSGWLAKDVALVFIDAGCSGVTEGAQAWLSAYSGGADLFSFPRVGLLQQALIVDLAGAPDKHGASSAQLSVHGAGGQLPNMDLYYLIKRNLDLHTSLPVSLRASSSPLPAWAQRAADMAGDAAAALGVLQPTAARAYAAELATLAAFSFQLASGQPTGAHAPFLSQQVDAATLALHLPALGQVSASGKGSNHAPPPQLQAAAASVLAAVEMCLRTLNNLQERLHHSTALYALLSADRFVSIGAYLAPPGCLLLAVLAQLVAASRLTTGAPLAAWRASWRRVAAAHALALAGTAAVPHLHGNISQQWLPPGVSSSGSIGWLLAQRWLWAVLAAAVAAAGPPALLASLARGSASGGSSPLSHRASSAQVQRCTTAVALAAVVLQGAHLLMAQWVRCFAFLLAAMPLHALAAQRPHAGAGRLAARAALLVASCVAVWWLDSSGAAWLAALLLPHFALISFN